MPAPQQWLWVTTCKVPCEVPMEESDMTGTALMEPTEHWAREPDRVTQNTGPAELGYLFRGKRRARLGGPAGFQKG